MVKGPLVSGVRGIDYGFEDSGDDILGKAFLASCIELRGSPTRFVTTITLSNEQRAVNSHD